jgi:SAM-dependent methyltransferase
MIDEWPVKNSSTAIVPRRTGGVLSTGKSGDRGVFSAKNYRSTSGGSAIPIVHCQTGVVPQYNHNEHYRGLLLGQMPIDCDAALDIGCGDGALSRQVAQRCSMVIGIDANGPILSVARNRTTSPSIEYIEGDFLTHQFGEARFDFVSMVASIHHMSLAAALEKASGLLRPEGVLAVLGVFRERRADLPYSAAAVPINAYLAVRRGWSDPGAPIKPPGMTLPEIRGAAKDLLPNVRIRRLLLWRYLLTWRHP